MRATIDRIEDDRAVLVLRDDESITFTIPLVLLPEIKESDIVDISITPDAAATKAAKEKSLELIKKIENKEGHQ
jgi:Protein of unknown function (DUF3006)